MVERAYSEAIATQGVVTGTSAYARSMAGVHRSRGQYTLDVMQSLFPGNQPRAQAAQLAFDRSYGAAIGRTGVAAVPGAELALDKLRGSGVRICLISGFSKKVFASVLDALGWWDKIDLVLTAMLRLGVDDVRETAVVMSTEAGVMAGRRAGAGVVAGVLTGPVPDGRLRRAGAGHILGSVADLPDLLTVTGPAEGAAGR